MKQQTQILGLPLSLYAIVLILTVACMVSVCVPKSLVPAFLVLMVLGEGLNTIGNTVPVIKQEFCNLEM